MKINQLSMLFFSFLIVASFGCTPAKKIKKTTKTSTVKTPPPPDEEAPKEEILVAKINFMKTDELSVALERAKKEKKPVFIDFYTTWCGPCKMMDESLFRDWDVTEMMNQNLINLKVDAEKGNGPALQAMYGVTGYPTFLFLDAEGKVLLVHRGTSSIADFKQKIKTAKWKFSQG